MFLNVYKIKIFYFYLEKIPKTGAFRELSLLSLSFNPIFKTGAVSKHFYTNIHFIQHVIYNTSTIDADNDPP